jgi:hypothetical protein
MAEIDNIVVNLKVNMSFSSMFKLAFVRIMHLKEKITIQTLVDEQNKPKVLKDILFNTKPVERDQFDVHRKLKRNSKRR